MLMKVVARAFLFPRLISTVAFTASTTASGGWIQSYRHRLSGITRSISSNLHQQQHRKASSSSSSAVMGWRDESPYCSDFGPTRVEGDSDVESETTKKIYPASCYCGRVKYEVKGDPINSKLCHCRGCQLLHGAPFEWVSIFPKGNVRFDPSSLDYLFFYSSELDHGWSSQEASQRILPVKVR